MSRDAGRWIGSRRSLQIATAAGLTALVATGCGFQGAASFPLPGGQGTGGDAYPVSMEFNDVLDLVAQSSVKVNDVSVGSVSEINLRPCQGCSDKHEVAYVTVTLKKDVKLPANSTARLRQTSLLGEKFVSIDAPPTGAIGQLRDQPFIPLARTDANAEIEEVLGALSLTLNGGSLEQLQTINKELIKATSGKEGQVKDLLNQLNIFVSGLDAQKADIVRALDSLDRLTVRLVNQRQVIATAIEDIPGGASVLADNTKQLTALLTGLDRLGGVATDVIRQSQANTTADLQALQPILTQLNAAGKSLPGALELLTTYPFPKTIDHGIRGDFANLFITLDLNLTSGNPLPGVPGAPPLPSLPVPVPGLPGTAPAVPVTPPKLPAAPVAPIPGPSAPVKVPLLDPLLSLGIGPVDAAPRGGTA